MIGFDLDKAVRIEEILEKYNINQVIIHQFDCIPSVFPACMNKNIPYIAYVHTGIRGTYTWFEKNYIGFNAIFNMYFNFASKIVAITNEAKMENMERYHIKDDKYIIINNSINFRENNFHDEKDIHKEIKKFLIVSRLAKEKEKSLINAINIFREYIKIEKDVQLTIIGDGAYKESIENACKDISNSVKMLGARNDVQDIMLENDVVIALDRCILEAVANKRIAVISGYEEIKDLVQPENIKEAAMENFSGRNLKSNTAKEIALKLKQLDNKKIEEIVCENYDFAYENLNARKNIYLLEDEKAKYEIDAKMFFSFTKNLTENIIKEKEYLTKVYNDCKENQEYFEGKIRELEKQKEELEKNYVIIKEQYETIKDKFDSNIIVKIVKKMKRKRS